MDFEGVKERHIHGPYWGESPCSICTCIKEVEKLKDDLSNANHQLEENVEMIKLATNVIDDSKQIREALELAVVMIEQLERVAPGNELPGEYRMDGLDRIKEALKGKDEPEPEPELWACCGAERQEIHGQYCPRCS